MDLDEIFLASRDFLISLTGRWSANKLLELTTAMGVKVRRSDALEIIRRLPPLPFVQRSRSDNPRYVSVKARFEVFNRDTFTCRYCGRSAGETVLEIDHIVAVSNGGSNNTENLITSCRDCNAGKSRTVIDAAKIPGGTVWEPVPKEKKEAKKRNIYITPSHPSDAPAPSFGTLEADVSIYLANAASENKTGEITPSRALGIRRSLAVLRDEMGVDSFARGLRIANAKGVPNIHYVKRAGTDKKSVSGTDKKSTLPAAVQDYLEGLK